MITARIGGTASGEYVYRSVGWTTHRLLLMLWLHTSQGVHCNLIPLHYSHRARLQGHHSAKPHTSCWVPCCHVHTCCSHCCELSDTRALSTHRSRVLVCRWFSLPACTRVTNFCHIFGRRNGGWFICETAYTRVYMVQNLHQGSNFQTFVRFS